jgi:hypothetical protein
MNDGLNLSQLILFGEMLKELYKPIPFRALSKTDFLANTANFAYGSMEKKTIKIALPPLPKRLDE